MKRREFLLGLAATGLASSLTSVAQAATQPGFSLPPLFYAMEALEPVIDRQTMQLHYEKHHGAYVKGLNEALARFPGEWSNWSLEELLRNWTELPLGLQLPVRNMAGGHWNHSLFWRCLSQPDTVARSSRMKSALEADFGSYETFVSRFQEAAMKQFGSGWAWLIVERSGRLQVRNSPNQDCPLMEGQTPILGLDCWEHAYYLKYQNRRAEYVEAFWRLVNWEEVERRMDEARSR